MTEDDNMIRGSGGLIAPQFYPTTFRETYRVKGILRRWRHRRAGWSTEWTVEYDLTHAHPVRDALPSFKATRGGVGL